MRVLEPVVLHDASNVLVHLAPAPVVARVATATGVYRPGGEWLAREVAVASHLASLGAPVVRPSSELLPGPHVRDAIAISFWELLELSAAPVDPDAAGVTLREVHEALASFEGELPSLAGPREAERMIPVLVERGLVSSDDAQLLSRAASESLAAVERLELPWQPLHGDSHIGNCFATRDGAVWGDLEDTFLGPVGWDLACLAVPGRIQGREPERIERAVAAHGGEVVDELVDARAVQLAVWTFAIVERFPQYEEMAGRWLDWVRGRYG